MSAPAEIVTARLRVRPFAAGDAAFIVALLNSPGWLRFIGDRGVHTEAEARVYIERGPQASYAQHGFGLSCVERRSDGVPVGMCGLLKRDTMPDVEIGFAFLPEYCGQGYAVESAQAVIEEGRVRHGLKRVAAIVQVDNAASIRVLEKLGLDYERQVELPNGGSGCCYIRCLI